MRPMSIRTRLVAGLAAGLVVLIAIMLYAVHRQALIETSELVNGDLVSAARIAVQLSGNEPLLVSPAPALPARHAYEPPLWRNSGAATVYSSRRWNRTQKSVVARSKVVFWTSPLASASGVVTR